MKNRSRLNRALGGIGIVIIFALLVYSTLPEGRDRNLPENQAIGAPSFLLGKDPPTPETFSPIQVVPRPPLGSGFETLNAADVKEQIDEDELVLAVEINGEARAWPLNVMTGPEREVFNDTLGGKAIAATW